MLAILAGTPIWVYPLLLAVIWLGARATRPRVSTRLGLARLPAIFATWSVLNIWLNSRNWPLGIAAWAGAVLVGAAIGRVLFGPDRLTRDTDPRRVVVPGTWWTPGLILAIFAVNYLFGYLRATSPGLLESYPYSILVPAIAGLSGGIFIGQAGVYLGKAAKLMREPAGAGAA